MSVSQVDIKPNFLAFDSILKAPFGWAKFRYPEQIQKKSALCLLLK